MRETILVADDDAQVLALVKRYLETRGYQVFTTPDGWECMRAVMEKSPDLVILDLNMPRLDGLQTLDMIRLIRMTKELPIILYSGEEGEEVRESAAKMGADELLLKPFSVEELSSKVKSQLMRIHSSDVKKLLEEVEKGCPQTGVPELLAASTSPWKAFALKYEDTEVCLCLRINPKESLTPSQIDPKKVYVFRKSATRWKQLWPSAFNQD